ncbi:MAG: LamG-like jellyroll fold domain-containing protein [Acholeplasmataceae bacterium]
MNNKSFTLIELLVVIVIIGILAGVIMISTSSSIDKANLAKAQAFSNTMRSELFSNLVSEWRFDEDEGVNPTTIKDVWGNNNGSVGGDPLIREGEYCVSGKCLEFDGSDYINFSQGVGDSLKIIGSQTFEMWLYPTDFTARRNPMGKAYGGEGTIVQEIGKYLHYLYGTSGVNGSPYQAISSVKLLNENQWNYVAIVRDLTVGKMRLTWFINGQEGNSGSANYGSATTSILDFYIGRGYCSDYVGRMDEIRIYNAPLNLANVKQNYIAGLDSLLSQKSISKEDHNQKVNELAYE